MCTCQWPSYILETTSCYIYFLRICGHKHLGKNRNVQIQVSVPSITCAYVKHTIFPRTYISSQTHAVCRYVLSWCCTGRRGRGFNTDKEGRPLPQEEAAEVDTKPDLSTTCVIDQRDCQVNIWARADCKSLNKSTVFYAHSELRV